MKLTDMKSIEEWKSILDRFSEEVRMTACLMDDAGTPLHCSMDRYPLCAKVRGNEEASAYICSQTNAAMLAVVKKTLRPEIDACEVGLLRVVVPVLRDGEVVGQIAACGVASRDDGVDSFVAAKLLGITEEEVEELALTTPFGLQDDLLRLAEELFEEINSNSS
jgi:ligand-binding sensor protein